MSATDTPPAFFSDSDYLARLGDIGFWYPRVAGVFARLAIDTEGQPVAGKGGTFPTLLSGNVAIKLFAHQALTCAFHRQAVGLAQHRTMDVFHKVPDLVALEDIETLDELAEALFGV